MECIFFVNPMAGAGEGGKLAEDIEQLALPSPVLKRVVFTDPDRLAQQVYSCTMGKDLVVLCGGDGTVSAIIAHLVNLHKLPAVAIIPIGTGNDIARSTGWLRSWRELGLSGLFHAVKEGRVGSFDVWRMGIERDGSRKEYCFCAYAGIGYDGRVCQEFSRLNRFLSKRSVPTGGRRLLYLPAGMRIMYKNILHPERIRCTVTYERDGKPAVCNDRLGQILFCNTGYYAGGSLIDRDYNVEDGLLEFFGIRGYVNYLRLLFEGRLPVPHSSLLPIRAPRYELKLSSTAYFQVDGEPAGFIESKSLVTIDLVRSIPLLKPLRDSRARDRLRDKAQERVMKKLSSSARPVVT